MGSERRTQLTSKGEERGLGRQPNAAERGAKFGLIGEQKVAPEIDARAQGPDVGKVVVEAQTGSVEPCGGGGDSGTAASIIAREIEFSVDADLGVGGDRCEEDG